MTDDADASGLHVLIVDDHAVVREGMAHVVQQLRPGCRVHHAGDATQAQAALARHPGMALVVLDVHLPGQAPLELLRHLRRACPLLPVVMLSADSDPELAAQALREGAAGWVPKSADSRGLASALELVLQGGCAVPPFLVQRHAEAPAERLTPRQVEILAQLTAGLSNKEIARALSLAEPTVKAHLVTIFRVLRVRNRAQAALSGQTYLRALNGFR